MISILSVYADGQLAFKCEADAGAVHVHVYVVRSELFGHAHITLLSGSVFTSTSRQDQASFSWFD